MEYVIYCKHCGKELGKACFDIYRNVYKGFTADNKTGLFCNEDCYNAYCDKFLIEEYNGVKIYGIKINGQMRYIPYMGCAYYFTTLDDCKKRIDNKNIAMVDMNMFYFMNN